MPCTTHEFTDVHIDAGKGLPYGLGNPLKVGMLSDQWSIVAIDGKPAAHFEHTIAVRNGQSEILSSFQEIERLEGEIY